MMVVGLLLTLPQLVLSGQACAGEASVVLQAVPELPDDNTPASPFPHSVVWGSCPQTLAPQNMASLYAGDFSGKTRCLKNNIAMIKTPQAASSNFAGVFRRIAARNGVYGVDTYQTCLTTPVQEPALCANHIARYDLVAKNVLKHGLDIIFATVRNPTERGISSYFKARGNTSKVDAEDMIGYINRTMHFQYTLLSQYDPLEEVQYNRRAARESGGNESAQWADVNELGWSNAKHKFLVRDPADLLADFQVAGTMERFHESVLLVALSLKLSSMADILHLGESINYEPREAVPQPVRIWLNSDEFAQRSKREVRLWEEAGKRMNKQITGVNHLLKNSGYKGTFQTMLQQFTRHLNWMKEECNADGKTLHVDDCYWMEDGCGNKCMDAYLAKNWEDLELPILDI